MPILKKELKSFFYSPIAYVVITMFSIINGYFFFALMMNFADWSRQVLMNNPNAVININEVVLRQLFGNMNFITLLMLPILTMKLFSEEKKTGTFELITTYPIKDIDLVLGKILSAVTVFSIMLLLTLLYPTFIYMYSNLDFGMSIAAYLGTFLLGVSFISLGTFISALTENQIVSAIVSFGVLLLFWVLNLMGKLSFSEGLLSEVFKQLSLTTHYENFSKGIIDISDITYYLSFIALSIFLTLRALESKKWRG
ncbi:MAG: ABC transporter permease [Candidatus Sericytochromatia bacterium]